MCNVQAIVGTFNQEKARVGTICDCENFADGSFEALVTTSPEEADAAAVALHEGEDGGEKGEKGDGQCDL